MNITSLSQEELTLLTQQILIPNIILSYVVIIFVFFFIGMMSIGSSNGKSKYFWIWLSSSLLGGVFIAIVIFQPDWLKFILDFFSPKI